MNVAVFVVESYETVPDTAVPPAVTFVRVKVVFEMVPAFMAPLKVTLTTLLIATPVAPGAGLWEAGATPAGPREKIRPFALVPPAEVMP